MFAKRGVSLGPDRRNHSGGVEATPGEAPSKMKVQVYGTMSRFFGMMQRAVMQQRKRESEVGRRQRDARSRCDRTREASLPRPGTGVVTVALTGAVSLEMWRCSVAVRHPRLTAQVALWNARPIVELKRYVFSYRVDQASLQLAYLPLMGHACACRRGQHHVLARAARG